jgi:hypothetical protein
VTSTLCGGGAGLAQDQANAQRRKARLVFFDESRGKLAAVHAPDLGAGGPAAGAGPPVQLAAGLDGRSPWYGVGGGGCSVSFHVRPGSYDTASLIEVIGELRRFLAGEKATLLWDGLPAHRSTAMAAFLVTQRDWLVVERLPGSAPDLHPVEQMWSSLKGNELANVGAEGLGEVIAAAWRGIERIRAAWHLPYSFLRHAGLSVS